MMVVVDVVVGDVSGNCRHDGGGGGYDGGRHGDE